MGQKGRENDELVGKDTEILKIINPSQPFRSAFSQNSPPKPCAGPFKAASQTYFTCISHRRLCR
jgi:hypothetical protein